MPTYLPITPVGTLNVTNPLGGMRVTDPSQFAKNKWQLSWIAGAGGIVLQTTGMKFNGEIINVITDPQAVTAANYSLKIFNEQGLDILNNNGATRSNSTNQNINPSTTLGVVDDYLTINITGANVGDTGNVWITIKHY